MSAHHIGSYLAVVLKIGKPRRSTMSDTSAGHGRDVGRYEIRLKGHLSPRWATRFDGMTLTTRADGTTLIDGPVVDQAALHGLLRTLRDLGLPLLSVTQVDNPSAQEGGRHGDHRPHPTHRTERSPDGLE
jgi:hypothetical protein